MKKFLSILLAVMMVLSTVSFAAPSLAGSADSALEMPVVEAPVEETAEAELAADKLDEFGTLLAAIDFDSANLGAIDFGTGLDASVVGGYTTSAANATNVKLLNGSGTSFPAMGAEVKEREPGNKYVEFTTTKDGNINLFTLASMNGASRAFITNKEGYLTVTYDLIWNTSAAKPHNIAYNREQLAEAQDQNMLVDCINKSGEWGRVISTFDEEQAGISGIGGNSATMTSATMVNYIKIHTGNGTLAGEKYAIDNIRVYWRPKTVDVTIKVEGGEDIVLNDYDTLGTPLNELAAMLPAVEGKKLVGFSYEKDGEPFATTKFANDGATIYPVYEEVVTFACSLEFNDASDINKISKRGTAGNNALGANYITIEDGALKATFQGTDTTKVVQDTGFSFSSVSIPAGALTSIETRVRFTGMPTSKVTLIQASGGTRNYDPASVNFPQYYFTTGGKFVTSVGEGIRNNLSDANGKWITITYTPTELGITDLSTFRYDFYDFMPHGSTLEIDYIRFIGKPVRVTVDNGTNKTAPAVKMDLTATTKVSEVEAFYQYDHGDYKFLGLSRTPGGEVLASTELVSATGEATTLYAVWDKYEYLKNYSVDFNSEADEAHKIRIQQNNAETSYEWNKDGYITLKSVPKAGYEGTWDQQIYLEALKPETAIPAGVVSQIAVRMRYRNLPTEKKAYTVEGRADTVLNPAGAPVYTHISKYTATKWGEQLQSTGDVMNISQYNGEWFVRYLDADKYFKEGLAYARIDTAYPLPAGVEIDYDYIRLIGDNEDPRLVGADMLGEYGEKVFSVDFDDATVGELGGSTNAANLGLEKNSWLLKAANGITFNVGASGGKTVPTKAIKEKSATDKYFEYTLNADSTYSYFFFSTGSSEFVNKDGYFIVTYDYKTTETTPPFTFRINKHDLVQDTAENIQVIGNGEWKKAVLYYDVELGTGTHSSGNVVTSTKDISVIKWHPTATSKAGQTVAIDNFTLWFVPKTVDVTVDLSDYGKDNVELEYPTKGMSKSDLEKVLPAVKDYEITGVSLVNGGEAQYQNRVAYSTTLYPVYEKVNLLSNTLEFNSASDISKMVAECSSALRTGRNNALTANEQYKIVSEDGYSFLRMENSSVKGEQGLVIDYGFLATNSLVPSEIKEIVINMRVSKWAPKGTYQGDDRLATSTFNPASMSFQLYFMGANGSGVKKEINPIVNAEALNGEWFTYTIDGSLIPADAVSFRFDPPDILAHGTVIDVDYIRFYGEPIPDAVPLKWSSEFDTSEAGLGLTSWKKADGTYMCDDGVNGDYGVGTGSAFVGNADDYITWNEDGYVTVNFVANEEVKAAAAEKGATAFVYDASAYVASLDKASYIPAGAYEDLKIRMRFRDLPADGTALYGLAYSNWQEHTWNLNDPSNYFYFHYSNVKGGTLYEGATATKQSYDDIKFKGTYANNEWFEVTIPASYFKADVNPLEILRLNIPNWMPDGAKLDIDYIRFMGKAPEAEAPVTAETAAFRAPTEDVASAIRFMGTITAETEQSVADIGWIITRASYLEANSIAYANLDMNAAAAAGNKIIVAYNRESGVDNANWFASDDLGYTFAAALKNVPAKNALDILVVRTLVKSGDDYLYGNVIETSLFEVAIEPYVDFISEDFSNWKELLESGYTFDEAIGWDFEYNNDYEDLDEAQQLYIEETLIGLLG